MISLLCFPCNSRFLYLIILFPRSQCVCVYKYIYYIYILYIYIYTQILEKQGNITYKLISCIINLKKNLSLTNIVVGKAILCKR